MAQGADFLLLLNNDAVAEPEFLGPLVTAAGEHADPHPKNTSATRYSASGTRRTSAMASFSGTVMMSFPLAATMVPHSPRAAPSTAAMPRISAWSSAS